MQTEDVESVPEGPLRVALTECHALFVVADQSRQRASGLNEGPQRGRMSIGLNDGPVARRYCLKLGATEAGFYSSSPSSDSDIISAMRRRSKAPLTSRTTCIARRRIRCFWSGLRVW